MSSFSLGPVNAQNSETRIRHCVRKDTLAALFLQHYRTLLIDRLTVPRHFINTKVLGFGRFCR